jgi:hypothetical protein
MPTQKTISFAGLLQLSPVKTEFGDIESTIKEVLI